VAADKPKTEFAVEFPSPNGLTPAEAEAVRDPTADWPVHLRFPSVGEMMQVLVPRPAEQAPMAPVALKVADFAKRWGFSKREIENRIRRGLPIVGEGRARRIVVAQGDAWMENHGESRRHELARKAAAKCLPRPQGR
jgi:hypothetical protein